MGQLDEAIACYQRALRLDRGFLGAHNNLLLALNYSNASTPAARFEAAQAFGEAAARMAAGGAVASPRGPATGQAAARRPGQRRPARSPCGLSCRPG